LAVRAQALIVAMLSRYGELRDPQCADAGVARRPRSGGRRPGAQPLATLLAPNPPASGHLRVAAKTTVKHARDWLIGHVQQLAAPSPWSEAYRVVSGLVRLG
jgi:hypothetical protein